MMAIQLMGKKSAIELAEPRPGSARGSGPAGTVMHLCEAPPIVRPPSDERRRRASGPRPSFRRTPRPGRVRPFRGPARTRSRPFAAAADFARSAPARHGVTGPTVRIGRDMRARAAQGLPKTGREAPRGAESGSRDFTRGRRGPCGNTTARSAAPSERQRGPGTGATSRRTARPSRG
jgi:hypothetical protein